MSGVSLPAVLVATLLAFVLGAVWYGPLFGRAWMAEHGFTEESLKKDFDPAKTYGTTLLLALVAAYLFGLYIGPEPEPVLATVAGFAVGVCWVTTSIATNYLFERRSGRLLLINGGYHAVRFGLIGLAFGWLG
jgi:hypothetical protein